MSVNFFKYPTKNKVESKCYQSHEQKDHQEGKYLKNMKVISQ